MTPKEGRDRHPLPDDLVPHDDTETKIMSFVVVAIGVPVVTVCILIAFITA